ncbi:unnamed protein product [Discosporangium mesarthrocarpum]
MFKRRVQRLLQTSILLFYFHYSGSTILGDGRGKFVSEIGTAAVESCGDALKQASCRASQELARLRDALFEGARRCYPPVAQTLGQVQAKTASGVAAAGLGIRAATGAALEAVGDRLGDKKAKGPSTTLNTRILVGEESFTGERDEISNRALSFWLRSAAIYLAYKRLQVECRFRLRGIKEPTEREQRQKQLFDALHEVNSERMLSMCLDLKGFYLKAGQFLSTRHDFMPPQYCTKLSTLLDQVPPMGEEEVRREIEHGLGLGVDEIFSELNLKEPVGSASISQVHEGRLKATGEKVAVKVQFPRGERVMLGDLDNLRKLASFLQRHEINFDLLSPVDELRKQVRQEFDFFQEATSMDVMAASLHRAMPEVSVPTSRLVAKKVLVMSFVEGVPFSRLLAPSPLTRRPFSRKGKKMLQVLSQAWGHMLFDEGLFNADPHPGNILLMPEMRIGLLDWGQVKTVPRELQVKLAVLMESLHRGSLDAIVDSFNALGVQVEHPEDKESVALLAVSMFDTKDTPGLEMNPLSPDCALKGNAVTSFPSDLFFVLRTVQMLRGLASGMGINFSVAGEWAPHTSRVLEEEAEEKTRSTGGSPICLPY